ncbi:MAG: hypothetical protein AAGI23_00150 [Bacteroidota bacterium]
MTVERKKIEAATWILHLESEQLLDEIWTSIQEIKLRPVSDYYSSYEQVKDRAFDLEAVKKEQNYEKPTAEELTQIAQEADIQESTEQLLTDLKSLDV